MSSFRFTDEATSTKYACVVCYTVPSTLLRAQCCGAVYCLQCGEQAQQSVTNTPQASACTKCASESLQLYHDALLQENVNKLQVECLHTGCGWRGELGNSRVHTAESHNGAINTETAHPEQAWAEQYYTPALSAQPPIADDFLQGDESSFQPSTSTDTQLSAVQVNQKQEQLQSIPKQDSLCQRLCNCCRNSEFADLSTVEKLLYVIGVLTAVLWMILVLSTSIITLITSIYTVKDGNLSFAPNCSNSAFLLWIVVLASLVVMVYLMFWLSRGCCKVFKKRSMNRAAVSSLCVITLIYAVLVIGLSTSIIVNVSQSDSNDDTSSSDMGSTWYSGCGNGSDGSGIGESGSGNCSMTETTNKISRNTKKACFEIQSQRFILFMAFLVLLLVFVAAVLCSLGYEFSHNGFCYKKATYDPTVTVFEKETSFSS